MRKNGNSCRGSALLAVLAKHKDGTFAAAAVAEFGVGVLLDGEEAGKFGSVGVEDADIDVEEGEVGGGEDESGDNGEVGVGEEGVMGVGSCVEMEGGLKVVVVLDPPVIVNCGLALDRKDTSKLGDVDPPVNCGIVLPESPNTMGEADAKSAHGEWDPSGTFGTMICTEPPLREKVLGERAIWEMQQDGARSTTERREGARGDGCQLTDVQFSLSPVTQPSKSWPVKLLVRGMPEVSLYTRTRGCFWIRDLWTDDDTLYKWDSVNEDENVKEEKIHETTSERDLSDSKREEKGGGILY
ncbi:hypothetical protein EDB84DRAFT_1438640 [Lactarius hengduanensis]|nr:hypothetical protein EDB84DRAFT_1438640 [Lactarius hengduanensis]